MNASLLQVAQGDSSYLMYKNVLLPKGGRVGSRELFFHSFSCGEVGIKTCPWIKKNTTYQHTS